MRSRPRRSGATFSSPKRINLRRVCPSVRLSVANNIEMKAAFALLRFFQQRVRQRIYRFCSGGPLVRRKQHCNEGGFCAAPGFSAACKATDIPLLQRRSACPSVRLSAPKRQQKIPSQIHSEKGLTLSDNRGIIYKLKMRR